MKKAIPVIIAISLIFLIVLGVFGYQAVQKYMPTKETAVLSEVYEVEGDDVALFYNFGRQEIQGIYEHGQTYLPLSWILGHINKRFYWDSTENLLVYTLPDQIVYADAETKGSNGAPLLLVKDEDVYLTLGLIANYSDVEIQAFDSGDAKRVFINEWSNRGVSILSKKRAVRVRGGIKSPILTNLEKDTQVTVLETMETWSKVVTPDGHIGYVENKVLGEIQDEAFFSGREPVVYESNRLDEKIVLGWHQISDVDAYKTLEDILDQAEDINVISPTWFALTDNSGSFRSIASQKYVDIAHEHGVQVWALLDNFSSNVQTEVLLASTTTRRKLINSLIAEVEKYGIDGLNMDFESIKPEAGIHYIQFLRELSIPCREKGIILSVDNYVPTSYNAFYDREEQGIVADYVIIMGYDEHYAGGEPGSVSSLGFVENGISGTLAEVPREKVINAVPFYTRLWTEKNGEVSSKALGIEAAKNWIAKNRVELYWQEELGQYYGELLTPSELSYLWLEEENSLELKMNLIRDYDLAGVACWKLGLEDDAAWDVIGWE
ncbi:MAG: SH3 domain-containing protein [Lachnospiraceae bacterium]|nr:SH3 domain-containing protein [Lachnospiraceae bacterium]MBQ1241256.1 SH3 domain-containing protein [Lachnospiraceae bacterium]MBQ2022809.1 SH3 domain-containing protein [Lachnospiraceae bacterium]MBQ5698763.1 SH3 domain-containing protein [Lachnospiraceae bacterium]MBQ5869992.1 SH3 domain-containing protein [Lachnospiraceae bacterium]